MTIFWLRFLVKGSSDYYSFSPQLAKADDGFLESNLL